MQTETNTITLAQFRRFRFASQGLMRWGSRGSFKIVVECRLDESTNTWWRVDFQRGQVKSAGHWCELEAAEWMPLAA